MPRYYFHLWREGRRFEDEDGQDFANADDAWEAARAAAVDLMDDAFDGPASWLQSHFEVTDASGEIVFELPFLEAVGMPGKPN